MIYPKKLSSKNRDRIVNLLLLVTILISIILVIINGILNPQIPWSAITNASIIYVWVTVIYSIKKNTNIAAHVLVQMVAISLLLMYIDKSLIFKGWSVYVGMPIVFIVANITMLILSILYYKKYTKYAIYQLMIVFISLIQVILFFKGIMNLEILNIISILIALINFLVSIILSGKAFYKVLVCNFHL